MNNSFGLDIGSTKIKAVSLQKAEDSYKFKSSIIADTPARGMSSESSLDHEEIATTLRKMVIDAKITSKNVNLALPDNLIYAKIIEMPSLSDKELTNAINWEAEQHIPVPLSTISLDWKVMQRETSEKPGARMQVLLVGAPISLLDKYQKVFEFAGINISSIESEILAVIRAIVQADLFPNSLIVNIGSLSTSIAIIQKGILVFLYTIPMGGLAINRSIATEFGFSSLQAEEYKKTYGIDVNNFGGKIRTAVEPIFFSLISEIKKAITYYVDKYKEENPIKQIVLSGGTARIPGIISLFVDQLGVETVIANPWKNLSIQDVPHDLIDRGPEFTIAVGLAIKDL